VWMLLLAAVVCDPNAFVGSTADVVRGCETLP
jgi:uncharacterized membrane protein YccC